MRPHSRHTDVTEAKAPESIAYHIKFLLEHSTISRTIVAKLQRTEDMTSTWADRSSGAELEMEAPEL